MASDQALTPIATASTGARVTRIEPGGSTTATVSSAKSVNMLITEEWTVPTTPGLQHSVQSRVQADGSHYNSTVYLAPGGVVTLSFSRVAATGVETTLLKHVTVPFAVTPREQLNLATQVTGTTSVNLASSVWPKGSTRSREWQATYVDPATARPITAGGGVAMSDSIVPSVTNPVELDVARFNAWQIAAPGGSASAPGSAHSPSLSATAPSSSGPSSSASAPSTATTSVVPTPSGNPASGAGSLPVGSAAYAVPANAIYVSPTGSDTAGTGSISAPYASLGRANSALRAGGTVIMRAGDYNADIFVSASGVTFQNYPGEAVWLDGSIPVSGWTQSGATWIHTGWGYQFDSSASFSQGSDAGNFVNASSPMAAHPDQLFFDGVQLSQVASHPSAGQFSVDYASATLTVGSDPGGHSVRASNLSQAFVVAGGNDTFRGFGIENYATSLPQIATMFFGGSVGGEVVQNVVITQSASQGISFNTPNDTADHITSEFNGVTGLHANGANGLVVRGSLFTGNNTQGFNSAPAAAAIKLGRMTGDTIDGNSIVNNNNVSGIWTDENVIGSVITSNDVEGNGIGIGGGVAGIVNELSDNSIIAGNTVAGSHEGIDESDSGDAIIMNNNVGDNASYDIGILQDNRYKPGMNTAGNNVQPSASNTWINHNEVIENNSFFSTGRFAGTYFQLYAMDDQTGIPADNMGITVAGNRFAASLPTMIGWGMSDNTSTQKFSTVAAFQAAKGNAWNNTQASSAPVTLAQQVAANAGSTNAIPLPAAVAAALGQPVGIVHVGAF